MGKWLGALTDNTNFFTGGAKAPNDPMKRAMEGFIGSLTGVLNQKKLNG